MVLATDANRIVGWSLLEETAGTARRAFPSALNKSAKQITQSFGLAHFPEVAI